MTMKLDLTHLSAKNKKYKKREIVVANGAMFTVLAMTEWEMHKASSILYVHVQRDTKRCYIGITVMDAGDRWKGGIGYENNRRFGRAIKKHGWDSFCSYVLAFADDRDALNNAEITTISFAGGHKSNFTYNLSPGGDMVAENDKPLVGVLLGTNRERKFKSGTDAARQLGMSNADMPMAVARGERTSVAGWWFRFADDLTVQPPKSWGEDLRVESVRRKQGKKIIAINYVTGEKRIFQTTAEAGKLLGVHQSAVSMVAKGQNFSAKGWWFKFDGDTRAVPEIHGQKVGRLKRDKKVYAVQLASGKKREFRNCTVADTELGIYKGAAASVASGERTSAADWWFSYENDKAPPKLFKGALVAKARSKAVLAVHLENGREQRFDSAKVAAETLGLSRAAISMVISGKRKSIKGYMFRLAPVVSSH